MRQQTNLRVQVLGVLAVALDGRVVPAAELASRKGRTLLKLLLARRGSVVPADVAADALWGGRLPTDPDANLATLVSRLRAVLGPEAVAGDRLGWRFVTGPRRGRGPPGRRAGPRSRRRRACPGPARPGPVPGRRARRRLGPAPPPSGRAPHLQSQAPCLGRRPGRRRPSPCPGQRPRRHHRRPLRRVRLARRHARPHRRRRARRRPRRLRAPPPDPRRRARHRPSPRHPVPPPHHPPRRTEAAGRGREGGRAHGSEGGGRCDWEAGCFWRWRSGPHRRRTLRRLVCGAGAGGGRAGGGLGGGGGGTAGDGAGGGGGGDREDPPGAGGGGPGRGHRGAGGAGAVL
jgi:hypothetical protein